MKQIFELFDLIKTNYEDYNLKIEENIIFDRRNPYDNFIMKEIQKDFITVEQYEKSIKNESNNNLNIIFKQFLIFDFVILSINSGSFSHIFTLTLRIIFSR